MKVFNMRGLATVLIYHATPSRNRKVSDN